MDILISSSYEELSPEDRLLLSSSKRVEPQGSEQQEDSSNSSKDAYGGGGGGSSSGGPPLAHGLQRAKGQSQQQQQQGSNLNHRTSTTSSSSSSDEDEQDEENEGNVYQNICSSLRRGEEDHYQNMNTSSLASRRGNNLSLDSNSAYNTLIIHHNNNSLLADTWIPASHEFTSLATGSNRNCNTSEAPAGGTGGCLRRSQERDREYLPSYEASVGDKMLSDIPRDYLNQLTVLKHLAKEVQADPLSCPNSKLLRSASFSRSQPDLSPGQQQQQQQQQQHLQGMRYGRQQQNPQSQHPHGHPTATASLGGSYYHCPQDYQDSPLYYSGEGDNTPSTSVQMLEILMRENSNLRAELANARMRIQTIHKLEAELTRLQKQHASLFESAERRESLERTARAKLSTEVKRLTKVNRELLSSSSSLQNLSSPYSLGPDVESYRKELAKKDATIAGLITQNKELSCCKERQDVELAAQRATLEEQRTHIDILDSALTTAQGNVVRLEEELGRMGDYAEKVSQLQRALSSLQLYNEKREQSEKKLRAGLESELTELKLKNAKSNNTHRGSGSSNSTTNTKVGGGGGGGTPAPPPPYPGNSSSGSSQNINMSSQSDELAVLQDKLRLSEDKIQTLSGIVGKWEAYFSPPPTLAPSTPPTPIWCSPSRGGTPFGDPASGSDLEWKIKELESRLLDNERAAAAAAAANPSHYFRRPTASPQHQPQHSLSTSRYAELHQHHPPISPVLFYEKVGKSEPPSYANLPPKLRLGGSGSSLAKNSNESLGSAGMGGGCGGGVSSEPESVSSGEGQGGAAAAGEKSIDEQLKDLNTQLLSKGLKEGKGLCCIPGLVDPSTPTRKGKIPQPLLESVRRMGGGPRKPPLPPATTTTTTHTLRTNSAPPFIISQETNTFSPAGSGSGPTGTLLKGLPPKSPTEKEPSKGKPSKSLERERSPASTPAPTPSKCKSLDRRELKREERGERGVGFFGALLSRRSPSPCRKGASGNKEQSPVPYTGRRFLFSKSQSHNLTQDPQQQQKQQPAGQGADPQSDSMETAFLDLQGRSSQSQRSLRKLANSTSNLDKVGGGGGAGSVGSGSGGDGRWGKIVKSPFGLRYTFGRSEGGWGKSNN